MNGRWLPGLLLVLLFGALAGAGGGKEQEAGRIQEELERIQKTLKQLDGEKKGVLQEIYRLELETEQATIRRNQMEKEELSARKRLEEQRGRVDALRGRVAEGRQRIARILRILYKLQGQGNLRLFLNAGGMDRLFRNHRLFASLIASHQEALRDLQTRIRSCQDAEKELRKRHDHWALMRSGLDEQIRSLRQSRAARVQVIHRIQQDRQKHQEYLKELQYEADHLNEAFYNANTREFFRKLDTRGLRRSLRWPLAGGRLIASFGREKSTRFNTYIFNNGIRIRPTGDLRVRALLDGVVILFDYRKGYGKIVVVQHGRNFHTIYGHLDQSYCKAGQMVCRGEVLGICGDTGSTTGRALYLEIREDLKALDPMLWLKR